MRDSQTIINKIEKQHNGDERQLEVIFSDKRRIMVEAPAGYGKTATMVSRIAYLYATGKIHNPKKVLALTFSVNAALKIKKDVAEQLPLLVNESNNPINVGEKITVTNYHGFCKGVLKKYGCIISSLLKRDIDLFCAIGEDSFDKNDVMKRISTDDINFLRLVESRIKRAEELEMVEIEKYNRIVIDYMLPHDLITHTSIILMTIELFNRKPDVKKLYQEYYPLLVVDEFQDTNSISWRLLNCLINNQSQILFLGDSLQRIYGFIGAIPNILEVARIELGAEVVLLDKNYRFCNNLEMLKLDKNLRANASQNICPAITDCANLDLFWADTHLSEAKKVVKRTKELLISGANDKIAILFRGRNDGVNAFEDELESNGIPYFYGMFTDEDPEYIDFHRFCQSEFMTRFGTKLSIGKRSLTSYAENVVAKYKGSNARLSNSLCTLLRALVKKVNCDYADISAEDKYRLILDVFENRQLKQAMEYVDANVVLSTIHGAKGLEWSYVFLADFERWGIPNNHTCYGCVNRFATPTNGICPLPSSAAMKMSNMLDELSLFYVAVTRARKKVFVSASGKRANEKDGCVTCFGRLPGINLVDAEKTTS